MEAVKRIIDLSYEEISHLGPVEASCLFNQTYVDPLGLGHLGKITYLFGLINSIIHPD